MRMLPLLALSCAAVALSACSSSADKAAPTPAAQTMKTVVAAPSATEEKEMASLMGGAAAETGTKTTPTDEPKMDAVPVESVTAEDVSASAGAGSGTARPTQPVAGAPTECPGVEVLPDTKSITYFDDPEGKPSGALIARASLVDIKGGCDYTADGVIVDIDMLMQGRIADAGRYEGRSDLEAFMTFPYFVAVMDPAGKMVDKKIMATAMRFKPKVDDLNHAEKITQTIPLSSIAQGPQYTITVGFQLNRAQLDYNRGSLAAGKPKSDLTKAGAKKEPVADPKKDTTKAKPEKKAGTKSSEPEAKKTIPQKAEAPKAEAPKAEPAKAEPAKTDATPATTPAQAESSDAKMTPIVE